MKHKTKDISVKFIDKEKRQEVALDSLKKFLVQWSEVYDINIVEAVALLDIAKMDIYMDNQD